MQNPATRRLRRTNAKKHRRGTIVVLAGILIIVAFGMVAFTVDVGYVLSSQQELQRSADSAALAACWQYGKSRAHGDSETAAMNYGRITASDYAVANSVSGSGPAVDTNLANSTTGDVVFGRIDNLYASNAEVDPNSCEEFNAVKVRIRRSEEINGEVPFFFARIFGRTGQSIVAEATAGYSRGISGVTIPSHGGNIEMLPFSLDEETWEDLMDGYASDDWSWDDVTKTISSGPDGVLEVNLFPQDTGSPGNRGTVDIGSNNNSTADIARQILDGISPQDLEHHGGKLEFDENGELELNGDTGISAGVKDELAAIKGQPRIIPIFSQVHGPGNNAQYTIVHWAGVRIMEVKLTGPMKKKRVIIQPASMVVEGVIAGADDESDYVYSPVVLVK